LKHWIAVGYRDFNIKLKTGIIGLLEEMSRESYLQVEVKEIRDVLKHVMSALEGQKEVAPQLPRACSLQELSAEQLAIHFTLLDSLVFRNIQAHEFLGQAWSKPLLKNQAANLLASIEHFNNISALVAHSILMEPQVQDRAKILTKFVLIADICLKYNNFHTVMAVTAALHNSAISRLKKTWAKLNNSTKKTLEKFTELFAFESSFKNYRDALRAATPPCIPYLGTLLGDLTSLEDGNEDTIMHGSKELVNFAKRRLIYELISSVLYFRDFSYDFPPEQVDPGLIAALKLLINSPHMSLNDMSQTSLKLEPREKAQ
jgi:hypothetical protein